jgi:hypothetical protein
LPALVVGNFMVLNLFLALLLNSFNCEELKSRKEVTILKLIFLNQFALARGRFFVLYFPRKKMQF